MRQTGIPIDRLNTQKDRHINGQTNRLTYTTGRIADIHRYRRTDTHTYTDTQILTHTYRHRYRNTDTDRLTDKDTQILIH